MDIMQKILMVMTVITCIINIYLWYTAYQLEHEKLWKWISGFMMSFSVFGFIYCVLAIFKLWK